MSHRPCQHCGRGLWGWEWVAISEVAARLTRRWTVTAPYGVRVAEGQQWTCSLCQQAEADHYKRANETETR